VTCPTIRAPTLLACGGIANRIALRVNCIEQCDHRLALALVLGLGATKEIAMAWNPRSFCVAILIVGFAACIGCEPEKKPAQAQKSQITHEAVPRETTPTDSDQAEPAPSQNTESTAETEKSPAKTPATDSAKKTTETSVKSPAETPAAVPPKTGELPKSKTTKKPSLPPPATMPKVSLTDKLSATCLVKVGDELPEIELAGVDGKNVALRSLYGDTLSVVFFWNAGATTYAQQSTIEALGDMQKDFWEPYAAKELKVVGINVGNSPEDAKKVLDASGARFPNLLDPQSDYFKGVATERLPRVYLLDAAGKILWFDIDYGRATRRQLQTGIKAVLEGNK
jgi:peroxiredoxin